MAYVGFSVWEGPRVVADIQAHAARSAHRIGKLLVRSTRNSLSMRGRTSPGYPPGLDRGRLRRSIEYKVISQPDMTTTLVGSWTVVYARIQEVGGTVTAKRGKYLTIPIHPAAEKASRSGMGALAFGTNVAIITSKAGNVLLCRKRADGSLEPLYLLKESVTLPARPYLRPALTRNFGNIIGILTGGRSAGSRAAMASAQNQVPFMS